MNVLIDWCLFFNKVLLIRFSIFIDSANQSTTKKIVINNAVNALVITVKVFPKFLNMASLLRKRDNLALSSFIASEPKIDSTS